MPDQTVSSKTSNIGSETSVKQPFPEHSITQQPQTKISKYRHRLLLVLVVSMITVASLLAYLQANRSQDLPANIHPYFSYSADDTGGLKILKPAGQMIIAESYKWQDTAYSLVEEHRTTDVDASRVYAYLGVAQLDAAVLSYQVHGDFRGSLSTVSKDVLCEFFQDSCSRLEASTDVYDTLLSEVVLDKIRGRMNNDRETVQPYTLKEGDAYWQGPEPQLGRTAGSYTPWLISTYDQFRLTKLPPESGSIVEQEQLALVKQALAESTDEQKFSVVKWSGGPGTKTPPGIWMTLADDYMRQQEIGLDQYLQIRAVTAIAMADAVGAAFDSKYTFQYKRPNMLDTSINTVMPTPNHPSYPSGHSVISSTAATVLSHYLPENAPEWNRLATEAGFSRIVGGIHFPIDDITGMEMGKNVGNAIVENW